MRTLALVLAAFPAFGACVAPTNPCDPAASPDVQAEGTAIAGRVIDQDGSGVAGVTVTVLGLSDTAVSGDDGAYVIEGIPPSAEGYTVRAEPAAPVQGGARDVGILGCQQRIEDADVVVAVPLDAPEVELVRAVTATSLLVAFGSGDAVDAPPPAADGVPPANFYDETAGTEGADAFRGAADVALDCRSRANGAGRAWRVQVRPPFDGWHDAVLNAFPWLDGDVAAGVGPGAFLDAGSLVAERTEDLCAAAMCAQFAYLEPSLADGRARCANVVGYVENDSVRALDAFGSYEVRVLTERKLDEQLALEYALAERVSSSAPAASAQISLVPGALLPLVDAVGNPLDGRALRVRSVVATGGGRFALVEDKGVRVLGGGGDVLDHAGVADVGNGAPQDAVAFDGLSDAAAAADFLDDGDSEAQALAALPAGDWLRVVKEGDVGAAVEKIYIGRNSADGQSGPSADDVGTFDAAEASLFLSPGDSALGALRAVSYLDPGRVSLAAGSANPKDAYLLLYKNGFVMVENGVSDALTLGHFAEAADGAGSFVTDWDETTNAEGVTFSGFDGDCGRVQPAETSNVAFGAQGAGDDFNGLARTAVSVCFDLGAATDVEVDLRDADVLPGDEPLQLVADAAADRVLVVGLRGLAGLQGTLVNELREVPVGREPVALTRSRALDCGRGGDDVDVILVANAGSADVSVLRQVLGGVVEEVAVAPLPASPVGFVDDPEGPSCADPFAWVIAVDGRLFPIDMRGQPSVPLCDGAPCQVSSRGRARTGAIAHVAARPARAVVGGSGLVGELGFFRPAALPGGAFRVFGGEP